MANTTHPGVSLLQRTRGGVYNVRWFDPRNGLRQQKLRSSETTDFEIATRIAEEIYRFVNDPEQWQFVPDGLHSRTYALLDVLPGKQQIRNLIQPPKRSDGAKESFKVVDIRKLDPGEIDNKAVKAIRAAFRNVELIVPLSDNDRLERACQKIVDMLEALRKQREEWKERALVAESRLKKMGYRTLRDTAAIEGLTLETALENWKKRLVGDDDYVTDQGWTAGMFVERFDKTTKVADMAGREREINDWIAGIKHTEGKREGQRIGAGRRQEIRRVVLKFLTDSGLDPDRKAIKRPGKKDVRNDRGAVRWLDKVQATAMANKVEAGYWNDCFRFQLATGLRPDELTTLKRDDFNSDFSKLTLSPLDHLTLKEGSRTITVPQHVRGIVERRLKKNAILFSFVGERWKKLWGKPWPNAKMFDRKYLAALRAAAKLASIPFTVDCRIARRTCATLLLAAGEPPKAVADYLGDDLQTILEHYAAAMPGSLDPSKAAIEPGR